MRVETTISSGLLNFEKLEISLIIVLFYYWPVLFLTLPDWIINVRYECEKEDRRKLAADNRHSRSRETYGQIPDQTQSEIPVESPSPVSLSHFLQGCIQSLPDGRVSFNLRLAFVKFCLVPFPFFVHEGLYMALKQSVNEESIAKGTKGRLAVLTCFPLSSSAMWIFYGGVISSWTVSRLILVFVLRPTDLRIQPNKPCCLCLISSKISAFCGQSASTYTPQLNFLPTRSAIT